MILALEIEIGRWMMRSGLVHRENGAIWPGQFVLSHHAPTILLRRGFEADLPAGLAAHIAVRCY